MLIIISSELTLFGNRRNRNTRMKCFKCSFKPLKIWVPSINCFTQRLSMDVVADIRLFENSSFLFVKFDDWNIDIFSCKKRTSLTIITLNDMIEYTTCTVSLCLCRPLISRPIGRTILRFYEVFDKGLSSLSLLIFFLIIFRLFIELFLEILDDLCQLLETPSV
jgi:hypothetical protein